MRRTSEKTLTNTIKKILDDKLRARVFSRHVFGRGYVPSCARLKKNKSKNKSKKRKSKKHKSKKHKSKKHKSKKHKSKKHKSKKHKTKKHK